MPEKIVDLSPCLRGNVITPPTSEYEVARKVYNGMIGRHPDAIVRRHLSLPIGNENGRTLNATCSQTSQRMVGLRHRKSLSLGSPPHLRIYGQECRCVASS